MHPLELCPELRLEDVESGRHRTTWCEGLEHRQRGGERHASLHELPDERRDGLAFRVDRCDRRLAEALSRTDVGLFIGDEVGCNEETVLEIVDAHLRGFAVRHRAEVTRRLHSACVSFVDRGAKLVARDVHVRLQGCRAGVIPEVDHPPSLGGVGERVHLQQRKPGTLEVGGRCVDPGAGHLSTVDAGLGVELTVAVHVAGGTHRRHAARQVQSRETLDEIRVDAWPGGVIEMLVHHHQPWNHRLVSQIEDLRLSRHRSRRRVTDRGDPPVANHDGLISARRGARAVDDSRVRERHDRGVDSHEWANGWTQWRARSRRLLGKCAVNTSDDGCEENEWCAHLQNGIMHNDPEQLFSRRGHRPGTSRGG